MRANEFLIEMPFVSDLNKGFSRQDTKLPGQEDDEDSGDITMKHLENIAKTIARDCAPFINNNWTDLQNGKVLYRGVKGADNLRDFFIKGNVRTDRAPRDTPTPWHNLMDEYFKKTFNYPYRSASMFAYMGSAMSVGDFGIPYAVFPIGDYDICYSPIISDMTLDLATNWDSYAIKRMLDRMSFDDVKNVGAQYGFQWTDKSDIIDAFKTFMMGLNAGMYRKSDEFGFDRKFKKFMMGYFLPRVDYMETYNIADIGQSEAMVKCGNYYGVLAHQNYRTSNQGMGVVAKLIGMMK